MIKLILHDYKSEPLFIYASTETKAQQAKDIYKKFGYKVEFA